MFKSPKHQMKYPNGYGGVIHMGGNRRKPWAVVKSKKVTVCGKIRWKREYLAYFETDEAAHAYLRNIQFTSIPERPNITLKEVYEEWNAGAYGRISKATEDNYKAAWKYLMPLENQKFVQLRTAHFQRILDEAAKIKSHSTLHKIKLLAHLLYQYALENDIVTKNYAEFLTLPKQDKTDKEIFSDIDIKKLENNIDKPFADVILILIYTGMRINELLTLSKFSVDLKNMTITGGLKTDAGKNRIIPINPKIQKYIKKWYDGATGNLVYRDKNVPVTAKYFRENYYYPLLNELKIARKTPHATRHTCATLLARAGADTNAIKNILGHTDYAFTADTYTHIDVAELKKAMEMI